MNEEKLLQEIEFLKQEIAELKRSNRPFYTVVLDKCKKWFNKKWVVPAGLVSALTAATIVFAATIPNTFSDGDTITAADFNANYTYIQDRLWDLSGSDLYYTTGNVGIGTTSPQMDLHVYSSTNSDYGGGTTSMILESDSSGQAGLTFADEGTSTWLIRAQDNSDNDLYFWRYDGSYQTTMALDRSTGNVGIGTTSPVGKLDIASGGLRVQGGASLGSGTGLELMYSGGDNTSFIESVDRDTPAFKRIAVRGAPVSLIENFTEVVRITGGNVGIGTTSPDGLLHIQNSDISYSLASTTDFLSIENNSPAYINLITPNTNGAGLIWSDPEARAIGGIHYAHDSNYMQFKTSSTEQMRIDSSGNVGIGNTSPVSRLAVTGLPSGTNDSVADGTLAGAVCISSTGNMYIDTDGTCAN